jgi:hypothetical protein
VLIQQHRIARATLLVFDFCSHYKTVTQIKVYQKARYIDMLRNGTEIRGGVSRGAEYYYSFAILA